MRTAEEIYQSIIGILDQCGAEYRLFTHREALTYNDLVLVQKETGFFGTEMKCMVLKLDTSFIVYITLQGNRLNFDAIRDECSAGKIRLASADELKEHFSAQPGCAYPFGFDASIPLYVDPNIYQEEWLLFSPCLPTKTIQLRGSDLAMVIRTLSNMVTEIDSFNL